MKCHNENHGKNKSKHFIIMLLVCLIPMAVIFILRYFYPETISWSYLLIMICPLLHIGMIIGLFKKSKTNN